MAADLGFPVVLKVRSAELHHKSGIGGVRLGIADRADRFVGLEVLAELDLDYDYVLDDERGVSLTTSATVSILTSIQAS